VSIGGYLVTKFEPHEKIIAKIDRAMYTSKRRGGDSFHIVSSGPYQNTSELIHLLEGMNHAHHNKFEVLYQPIIDLKGNSVHKVEVLLSPRSATLKALTTAEIIKDAIKHHLISNVTYFVLDKACHDFSDGIKNIHPNLTLGINITLHELIYDFPLLSNSLKTILKKYVVRPRQIVLEINEFSLTSIDSKDLDRAYKSIRQLKALGFGIAVDDFGSGYSNLPYFHEIDIDYLKIDKSYLQKIFAKNNKAEKIYRAICELSHNLGIRITAEGIESEKQLDYVNQVGVDFGQGYYFSRPLSIKKLISFLKKN
jgi:EAL domain-containing protein (putative c-di-GMP-specific phosphodiesterase class I)